MTGMYIDKCTLQPPPLHRYNPPVFPHRGCKKLQLESTQTKPPVKNISYQASAVIGLQKNAVAQVIVNGKFRRRRNRPGVNFRRWQRLWDKQPTLPILIRGSHFFESDFSQAQSIAKSAPHLTPWRFLFNFASTTSPHRCYRCYSPDNTRKNVIQQSAA